MSNICTNEFTVEKINHELFIYCGRALQLYLSLKDGVTSKQRPLK